MCSVQMLIWKKKLQSEHDADNIRKYKDKWSDDNNTVENVKS